jgi:hypothetical protein
MTALTDVWHSIYGIITSPDHISLAILIVIALAAGFMMQSFNSIVTTTFVALLAFALVGYLKAVTLGHQDAAAFAQTDWHSFLGLQMMTLLAYAITLAIAISVVHAIRSVVLR